MSRRSRYLFDEVKIQKYTQEGRGTGGACEYIPWLKIYDLPSKGRSHRPKGIKTDRVHHLLSDGEWKTFLNFEYQPDVLDIREQFPLDRFETYQAARRLGFRHPTTCDGTPYVMTIDFLVTREIASGYQLEAYSFKYAPNKLTERNWELHRIAEECLRHHGVQLQMLDETRFNDYFIQNYDTVRSCFNIDQHAGFDMDISRELALSLITAINAGSTSTLKTTCYEIAQAHGTIANDVFLVAKFLIARRIVLANLAQQCDLTEFRMLDLRLAPMRSLPW